MISVSKLTKAYGPNLAVDQISFEVPKGQVVGFLGPNGAGKSTTLRMLTCYLPPTSGGATVNGFDIFHDSEKVRENLGYLPENVPLYLEMRLRNTWISAADCEKWTARYAAGEWNMCWSAVG